MTGTGGDAGLVATPWVAPSRHRIDRFRLHRPVDQDETVSLLETFGGDALLMGGGLDVVARMKRGQRASHVISLDRVASLHRVTDLEGHVEIGACLTHEDIATDARLAATLPALGRVWSSIGNPRIRRQGTVIGNLVAGVPAYDVAPILLACGGMAVVHDGRQVEPTTVAGVGHLVRGVRIPTRHRLTLVGERRFRPLVSVYLGIRWDGARCIEAMVSVGCAYDTAVSVPVPGLRGMGAEQVARAGEAVEAAAVSLPSPIDDQFGSSRFRAELIRVACRRLPERIEEGNQ